MSSTSTSQPYVFDQNALTTSGSSAHLACASPSPARRAPGRGLKRAEGANANLLIPAGVADPISGSLPHRTQRCRVRKAADAAPGAR